MINLNKYHITEKKCKFMPYLDYERLVKEIAPNISVDISMEGLTYWNENDDFIDYDFGGYEKLSEVLGVKVTSVHVDDCDYAGVWIAYITE